MTDIQRMVGQMNRESKSLLDSALQLTYFMRGAISYNEIMNMSRVERDAIAEFIEGRLEVERKRSNPVY